MTNSSYIYKVLTLKPLTDRVTQIFLQPMADARMEFKAGQYIEIHLSEDSHNPFSIANAPLGGYQMELHISHSRENAFTNELWSFIKTNGFLHLSGPYGKCILQDSRLPILFIASGTGFAPMKSLIEQALSDQVNRDMTLIWNARTTSDLYLDELPSHWTKHIPYFHYLPIVSELSLGWEKTTSKLEEKIKKKFGDLSNYHVYIAGPKIMVDSLYLALQPYGLTSKNCFSDLLFI